ncbi:hypothetical protein J4455_01190 [Candidatus Woesearchaeota archaeon]|nr:hypothetical protein [Candidatus Woesearchaeota archaeon]
MNLTEISEKYSAPIIALVGAMVPLPKYESDETKILGYELRKAIGKKGTLFTGGVNGVGVDFYKGIVDYCKENSVDDRFFVLLPEAFIDPASEYMNLAKQLNCHLKIERVGNDMEERRTYVAQLADKLVVVNGSKGTLDECVKGLFYGKEIICLENSGGAADVLAILKRGEISNESFNLNLDLIKLFGSAVDAVKYLSTTCLNDFTDMRGNDGEN